MYRIFLLSIILFLLVSVLNATPFVDNYEICFSKLDQSENVIKIHCEFDLILNELSSGRSEGSLRFGGLLEGEAVQDLVVVSEPRVRYLMKAKEKRIVFQSDSLIHDTIHVGMDYVFMNFSTAFNYRSGEEMWETSYDEFFYPHIFGQKADFRVKITVPDSLWVVGSYSPIEVEKRDSIHYYFYSPKEPIISHSFNFSLLPSADYEFRSDRINNSTVDFYLQKDVHVPNERIEEVKELTVAAVDYFSKVFDDDYFNLPVGDRFIYVFHSCGYCNRNNFGFITASQEKVATKPHLLPLVHEIGHRWLGEWTFWIEDGTPSAYFILESLNEYMTLMFARDYYGQTYFDDLYQEEYLEVYDKIRNTTDDMSLYKMMCNNNDKVVYVKGPIIIHEIVKLMGEEKWTHFLRDFYAVYGYKKIFGYDEFLSFLYKYDHEAANAMDVYVRAEGDIL